MPTARPIIVARIGVVVPTVVNTVAMLIPNTPSPTPTSAERIGSPEATSEPKVMISTTSATPMPSSSLVPPVSTIVCMPDPFASAVRPSARAAASTSSSFSWVAGCTSATDATS